MQHVKESYLGIVVEFFCLLQELMNQASTCSLVSFWQRWQRGCAYTPNDGVKVCVWRTVLEEVADQKVISAEQKVNVVLD